MIATAELVSALERCDLDPEQFGHREHVEVAWHYLRTEPLLSAIPRFAGTLRRFANHHGATAKYNETITLAYLLLIEERLRGAPDAPWEVFAEQHRDLIDSGAALLARFYSPAVLTSHTARAHFVLPDTLP